MCPAPVVEIVNNGHVDGLAIPLIVAALIVVAPAQRSRGAGERRIGPRREIVAAALICTAALIKLYPAALLLPLVAYAPGRRVGRLIRVSGTVGVMTAIAYGTHVARVGVKVLGYLPGYLNEESYRSGGRYLIAHLLYLPDTWTGVASLLSVIAVAGWIVIRRRPLPIAATAILAALLLASSPAQTWYAVSLLAVATVAARPTTLAVLAGGYIASFATALDRTGSAQVGGWGYAAALVVMILAAARRQRKHAGYHPANPPLFDPDKPPAAISRTLAKISTLPSGSSTA